LPKLSPFVFPKKREFKLFLRIRRKKTLGRFFTIFLTPLLFHQFGSFYPLQPDSIVSPCTRFLLLPVCNYWSSFWAFIPTADQQLRYVSEIRLGSTLHHKCIVKFKISIHLQAAFEPCWDRLRYYSISFQVYTHNAFKCVPIALSAIGEAVLKVGC